MIDLYGEHWPIDIDAHGDGPITDPAVPSYKVCIECNKPWPCPTSELVENLREGLADLRKRIERARAYLSRDPRTGNDVMLAVMALDGHGPHMLIAADPALSSRSMPVPAEQED